VPTDVAPVPSHDAHDFAVTLAKKLSSRHRHISFLLGAGASKAAGLPDMQGLESEIRSRELAAKEDTLTTLLATRSLEAVLTWLRRLAAVLEGSTDSFAGLTHAEVVAADKKLCKEIMEILLGSDPTSMPHLRLASWIARTEFDRSVEIFSLNYDLLVEQALEASGVPYFDGFLGNYEARFTPDLVDQVQGGRSLPPYFARVWKLHGSLSWVTNRGGQLVRIAAPSTTESISAIHPSESKYTDSRRAPFVILQDRFRRSLLETETIAIISGYSLGDEHINEILFECAKARPRSEFIFFMFDGLNAEIAAMAENTRNITAIGPREAVISGVRAAWDGAQVPSAGQHYWLDGQLSLGDFSSLADYLAGTVGALDDQPLAPTNPPPATDSSS